MHCLYDSPFRAAACSFILLSRVSFISLFTIEPALSFCRSLSKTGFATFLALGVNLPMGGYSSLLLEYPVWELLATWFGSVAISKVCSLLLNGAPIR